MSFILPSTFTFFKHFTELLLEMSPVQLKAFLRLVWGNNGWAATVNVLPLFSHHTSVKWLLTITFLFISSRLHLPPHVVKALRSCFFRAVNRNHLKTWSLFIGNVSKLWFWACFGRWFLLKIVTQNSRILSTPFFVLLFLNKMSLSYKSVGFGFHL